MTTVSALPPSATPTKAGGGKPKTAEGGDDFAALLAGLATPATAEVTPPAEGGTPGSAPAGVVLPLVVDLSQFDLAGAAGQAAAPVPGQPAVPTAATLAAQPAAVPAPPAVALDDAAAALPTAAPAVTAASAATTVAAGAPGAATASSTVTEPGVGPGPRTGAPVTVISASRHQPATPVMPAQPVVAEAAAAAQPAVATPETVEQAPAATTSLQSTAEVTQTEGVEAATASTSTDADADADSSPQPQAAAPAVDAARTAPAVPTTSAEQVAGAPVSDSRAVSAPAAPAPPAPAAPAPPPATQVLTQLGPTLEGPDGTYTMSLQLYPEDLGAVQVEVSLRGGEISLALHAADDVAKELLRASLSELRQQLEATGLTATDVSVDSGEAEQRDPAAAKHAGSGSGDGDDDAALAPPPATDPDAALDVRI